MAGVRKSTSDVQDASNDRRAPVFSSQRFEEKGNNYSADELIARLMNQTTTGQSGPIERHASQRRSSASDTIIREFAEAEAAFEPHELLQEGLDEWHDKSLTAELLKRTKTAAAYRRRASMYKNPTVPESVASDVDEKDSQIPISQQLNRPAGETRHRYNFDFDNTDVGTNEDGNVADLPKQYGDSLPSAPPATLIHLIVLYHQALVKKGGNEEAQKIAGHLSQLEAAESEDLAAELSGIDLLLKDGLLKYLTSIQPFLPTIPTQVIKFKNVGYKESVQIDTGYESVGTKALETIKGPLKKSPLHTIPLLTDLTGYFMPGTLTLIMGTLGCGSLVVNRVLAGQSNRESTTGSITYNGRSVHAINSRRYVSFVGPNDAHMPGLTVRETLEFARECSQYHKTQHYGDNLRKILGDVVNSGQDPKLETNLSMLGIKRIADKPVGSPMMPSISEAERHRVSVAEMSSGTYAVYMFDQLNKGVDDSVTFDLITAIRIFSRVRSLTVVATLMRPSQDVFDMFDRVILLDRSHVMFQGPTQDALPYFESLGYIKPRQLNVPEFLEEVTTTAGADYIQPGFAKLSHDDFVNAYKNSDTYKDILRVVDNPDLVEDFWVEGIRPLGVNFVQSHENTEGQGVEGPPTTLVSSTSDKGGSLVDLSMTHTNKVHPGDEVVAVGGLGETLTYLKKGDSTKGGVQVSHQPEETIRLQLERPLHDETAYLPQFARAYVQDPWPEFKLLLKRDLQSTWRNKLSLYIRTVQVLVLAFYIGGVFFRIQSVPKQLDMTLKRSVFFVSLLDMTLFNLGQLPGLLEERKVYYKQQGAHFFRPSSYLFAKVIGSLPFSLAEATTWTIIVYFMTGLSVNQGGLHFWVFYIIIVLSVLNGAALVRFVSAFAPDAAAAGGIIGITIAVFVLFAGFLVPRFQIPHYWIWAYYLDPVQWGITALVINEFNSKTYQTKCRDVPNLLNIPQCQGRPDQTVGHAFLAKGQFYTGQHWIGIAIAMLVGWLVLWTVLTYLALKNIRHIPRIVITRSGEARFLGRMASVTDLKDRDVEDGGPTLSLMATPLTVSWHELTYDIPVPGIGRSITLLNHVSGWAEPGELVGIMGVVGSGAGILVNCLAGRRVNVDRIGGQILVNGYPKDQNTFATVSSYADRLEAYSPYMTVREAIIFSCDLQLQKTTSSEKRKQFVDEIIDLLDLGKVEDTLVKSLSLSALTLSESVRLRIGSELARNPSALFLDAPTNTLDSRTALHLVKILRAIADSGRIVIVDLSPARSQRVLTLFTSLQILKRGGDTVYWGPVGNDGDLIKNFFESIPGTAPCPPNRPVSSYALEVIGDGPQDRKTVKDYAFEYRVNELALHNHVQLQQLRRGKGTLGPKITDSSSGSSYLTRIRCIFWKLQLYYWRNVPYSWGRLFSMIIMALLLGSVLWDLDTTVNPGLNAKVGGIFISTLLVALNNANAIIPQVVTSQAGFARERSNRQINIGIYVVGWTICEIQYLAVSTLVFAAIFCSMTQLATQSAARFFLYWFVMFLVVLVLTFLGMLLATVVKIPQIAGTLVTLLVGFWVATSGAVVPKRKILHQFIWIFWTNPIQYGLTAMTSIAFFCDVQSDQCLNNGLNPGCATTPALCPQCHCQRLKDANKLFVWSSIKYSRSLRHGLIYYEILALICFAILFRVLHYLYSKYRFRAAAKRKLS